MHSFNNRVYSLKMSAICHGFVHNAWRKDICSNCFRVRDEHPPTEIHKSVICNGTTVNNSADNNNGVNIFSNGAIIKSSNETLDIFGSSETLGKNQSSQKFNRFHTVTSSTSSTATSVTSSSPSNFVQGSSCIPRINGSGGASSNNNSATGSVGKFSGTNSVSTTITKGHINSVYGNNSNGTSTLPETNDKVKSTEGTIAKTSPSQTLSSTSNQNQPQLQGKGMMTNQHPSKCDNGSVIPNHNNNKQSMSSSAGSQPATRSACASIASSSTASSSFIASKNIFNNAASSAISTTTTTTFSTTGLAACVNVNGSVVTSAATASGSTGLSHPQSATSNKRGSINNVGLSQPSSTLQKSGVIDVASHNNCVVAVAVPGASHRNLENPNKNGLIESKEFSDGVSNIINISSGVTSGVIMSSNKGAITQSGTSRGARAVKQMDVTDGGIERRKVGFPSASGAGNSGDKNVNVSKGNIGGNVKSLTGYKGILRSKNASRKRDRNVRFPDEI
ncbi:hypothetical protein Ocin01_04897 [Orchesella cincta]|uniref:Uncharacterized protein n=1 Tax=Orchesella cincta TaxID=48709 RepID=A0A1D2N9K7_ORCCI|nr:hypothetical protein Ocin01_04897 [Orchesella cincta]